MGTQGASLSAGRLIRQFERTGGTTESCGPFRTLPESTRESIAASVDFKVTEEPVIACFFDEDSWTLLTTERLIWKDDDGQHVLKSVDLTTATVEPQHLFEARSKKLLDTLTVGTADLQRFSLRLEPGPPFFGFWNVLKLVAR